MKKIDISDFNENFSSILSSQWMLITAGNRDSFNTMTASWGGIGYLWNKHVVHIYIRPERYTYEFVEKNDYFTLCFLGEQCRDILSVCGTQSGRNIDKVKQTGLKVALTDLGNISFEQSRLTIECKKLYSDLLKEEHFVDKDSYMKFYNPKSGTPHKMYIAEIVNLYME